MEQKRASENSTDRFARAARARLQSPCRVKRFGRGDQHPSIVPNLNLGSIVRSSPRPHRTPHRTERSKRLLESTAPTRSFSVTPHSYLAPE